MTRLAFNAGQKARLAVLISGRGSNMAALARAAEAPDFPAGLSLVFSNNPDAPGLAKARAFGVKTVAARSTRRHELESALRQALAESSIDLIVLAGYMRLLSADFTRVWRDKILNIHPSLLPAFPGLDTHQRALDASVHFHGATVHIATETPDAGPILGQAALTVNALETANELAARVLTLEHQLLPDIVQKYASGEIWVENGQVQGVRRQVAAVKLRQ
jgi:phosphoribosylglycinamide formyltransferase-1